MHDGRDRATPWRIFGWIAAVAVGMLAAILVGGWVLDAFLSEPALEPASYQQSKAASAEATPAATPAPATVPTAVVAAAAAVKSTAVPAPKAKAAKPKKAPAKKTSAKGVVVIDAGHQGKGDLSTEPIGPGASERKPKVAYGATGSVTHVPENVINLKVALKLRDKLEARGVKVIMVRTKADVNIANSERAKIANRANADLLIRVHCDDVNDSSIHGFLTMVPEKNKWTGPIVSESRKAGALVQAAAVSSTGAHDRGLMPTSAMSGFNWAKVPSIIVEMGLMSNASEDRKLATSSYQDKLAEGIADGTVKYLSR